MTGFEYDDEWHLMTVLYDAPSADHRLRLSGTYTGEMETIEDGIYRDSYIDMDTGERR